MAVPSLNPVSAPTVICPNCKSHLEPEIEKTTKRGMPDIKYVCVNEASNCSWVLVLSQQHIMGDMTQLKPEEVESRREQAKAAEEMTATHDAQVRKLIMLLPHLELLLAAVQPDKPKPEDLPGKPYTADDPETIIPSEGNPHLEVQA